MCALCNSVSAEVTSYQAHRASLEWDAICSIEGDAHDRPTASSCAPHRPRPGGSRPTKLGGPRQSDSYPYTLALPPLPFDTHSPMPSLPPPRAGEETSPTYFGPSRVLVRPGFEGKIQADGSLVFGSDFLRTGLSSDPTVGPRFGGSFDLTDMFSPQDPYLREKFELMEETFEYRAGIRDEHNRQVLDRSIEALPSYLRAVWEEPVWDAKLRRQLLFALWDECAEGGAPHADEGARARQIIEAFIAQNLPRRSAQGFSPEELQTFNAARTSSVEFAPL